METIPISSFGSVRVPRTVTPEVVIGQMHKRMPTRTKAQQKEHILLRQFHARGLPKNRLYDINCENPMNDSFINNSDSDHTLQQWFGYESSESEGDEIHS